MSEEKCSSCGGMGETLDFCGECWSPCRECNVYQKKQDEKFARELIKRVNALLEPSEAVRRALYQFAEHRKYVEKDLADHPSIQVLLDHEGDPLVGFIGVLNGIVGVVPDGERKGWGYIVAHTDDDKEELIKLSYLFDNEGNNDWTTEKK